MNFVIVISILFKLFVNIKTLEQISQEQHELEHSIETIPDEMKNKFIQSFEKKYAHLKQKTSSILPILSKKSLGDLFAEKLSENLVDILQAQIDYYNKNKNDVLVLNESFSNDAKVFREVGDKKCSLTNSDTTERKAICPSHLQIKFRKNMFPRLRLFAKCNCKDCLFKTTIDYEVFSWSKCEPVYFLMPALIQEQDGVWKFVLEQVPVSCRCTMNFRTF